MLFNYLKTALRSLSRYKFYSAINILGLSIGLACFILISLYVKDELSYDRFQKDLERTYRMDFAGAINGNEVNSTLASAPAAETMKADFPEVEDAFRFRQVGSRLFRRADEQISYKEDNVVFADANFFQFFTVEILNGDPETALERPNTLVLSESLAKKVFGDENPIGKTIVVGSQDNYEVTGVFNDLPPQSHFHYNLMLSMASREEANSKFWMSFNFSTYLKLQEGFDYKELEGKFPGLIEKYIGPEIERFMGASLDEFYDAGNSAGFSLFPMKKIHLESNKLGELEPNGDIRYVYIFGAIALFILVLACINFMNLATARSANRAKEVGIRKVMGAYRGHLINQFLSEAVLLSIISFAIALGLASAVLPAFNDLATKELALMNLFSSDFILLMVAIVVIVGFLAGSYPAFYLSSFRPIQVLKGKLNLGLKSGGIRSSLVVIQFTVSIIMIVGTAIVFDQLSFIQNKKLGFSKDQVIMLHDAWLMDDQLESFKNEAIQDTKVLNGTIATFLPVGTTNNNNLWFKGKGIGSPSDGHVFHNYRVDHDYISTLGMEIESGRDFSRDFPSDSLAIVINETAAKQLNIDGLEGAYLTTYGGSQDNPVPETYKIIGIVKDFHFLSLRKNIEPLLFQLGGSNGFVSFKVQSDDIARTIDHLEAKWDEFAPGQPFAYSFLDDRFNELYESEQQIGDIFGVFAFLSIFIACLGLYGLAAFTAEQKTKEIGIRKVLGASIASILALLSKEFMKLVLISFVIGGGVAYYFMNQWLNDFEYRTNINNPVLFLVSGLLALLVAWLTMSSQSYRAARANPVNSLKEE